MKKVFLFCLSLASFCSGEGFTLDRSVMSEAYRKIWSDEVLKKLDADIAKYRMADKVVLLEGVAAGAEVRAEQIEHAFFFGAHIFNYNQLGKKEWNDRYKELYGTLFNSATVAFYWRTLEPYPFAPRFLEDYRDTEEFWSRCAKPEWEPHWRRPAIDPVIDFLMMRNVRIHGHTLVWGEKSGGMPGWLWDNFCPPREKRALEDATGVKIPRCDFKNRDPMQLRVHAKAWYAAWKQVYAKLSEEEIAECVPTYISALESLYERRVRLIAERYGSRIESWDVVNESASDFDEYFGSAAVRRKAFDKSHYGPMPSDYAHKAFVWAQKYLPRMCKLNINDYNMPAMVRQVNELFLHGARIDTVGSQMHLFDPAASVRIAAGDIPEHLRPEKLEELFRLLSQANRPIHLSEVTITAPDSSERGQMIQAVIMSDLYRAWFSVELMNGITWWNVVDGCGWAGEPSTSGIFTRDMKPKAAYYAMDNLINREWKSDLRLKAGVNGRLEFRGFRGRYRLSWKDSSGAERSKNIEVR